MCIAEKRVLSFLCGEIQGSAKRRASGLVNIVAALAYHFWLALPAAFTQPGDHLLAEPCISSLSLWTRCPLMREPEAPSGCPMAMAPPHVLNFGEGGRGHSVEGFAFDTTIRVFLYCTNP